MHVRVRVIELRHLGPTRIAEKLADEGHKVGRGAIYNILKKWDEHGLIGDKEKSSRPWKGVTMELLDFIDSEMARNDELSAYELKKGIEERFGVKFSLSNVKNLHHGLGWVADS